jgi:hypothetical protein
MKDIALNKEEFKLFDQDDQFGFFYDDDGWPKEDADETFDSDVDNLFQTYESILIDNRDNVYGFKNGHKEIIFESVIEAYTIAREVKDY